MTQTQPQGLPELIGSLEAARRLRMHRATFNKLVGQGEIPVAAKIPGLTGPRLFDATVIDQLAEEWVTA